MIWGSPVGLQAPCKHGLGPLLPWSVPPHLAQSGVHKEARDGCTEYPDVDAVTYIHNKHRTAKLSGRSRGGTKEYMGCSFVLVVA